MDTEKNKDNIKKIIFLYEEIKFCLKNDNVKIQIIWNYEKWVTWEQILATELTSLIYNLQNVGVDYIQ